MTFWFARNYCKPGCAQRASRQPWGAAGQHGGRAEPPSHRHPLGTRAGDRGPCAWRGYSGCRLPIVRLWVLPSEQPLCYGAKCTAVVPVTGEPAQAWGTEAGARRSPPCWDRSGLGSVAMQAAPAWEAEPATGSGAPACSGRSNFDSCNVSVACLSFHGVSILQPPSVLIPEEGGGGVHPGTTWLVQGSKRRWACLNFTCSNSSSNICWLIKGRLP